MKRLPLRMQRLSHALHRRGWGRSARLVAWASRLLFSAVLAPQAELAADVDLAHGALGLVIHPCVRVGARTQLQHHVTLGTDTPDDGPAMVIGQDVWIGAHAILLGPITVGDGAQIGAGAVITKDVAPGTVVVGGPMRLIREGPAPSP